MLDHISPLEVAVGTGPDYQSMTIQELSRKLGEAEFYADEQNRPIIQHALDERVGAFVRTRELTIWDQLRLSKGVLDAKEEYKTSLGQPSLTDAPKVLPFSEPVLYDTADPLVGSGTHSSTVSPIEVVRLGEAKATPSIHEFVTPLPAWVTEGKIAPRTNGGEHMMDREKGRTIQRGRIGKTIGAVATGVRNGYYAVGVQVENLTNRGEPSREKLSKRSKVIGGVALGASVVVGAYFAFKHGTALKPGHHVAGIEVPVPRNANSITTVTDNHQHVVAVKTPQHVVSQPPRAVNIDNKLTSPDTVTVSTPKTKTETPWKWAQTISGRGRGQEVLKSLSKKAQSMGHKVQWHGKGVKSWLEVDGHSDTSTVIKILSSVK